MSNRPFNFFITLMMWWYLLLFFLSKKSNSFITVLCKCHSLKKKTTTTMYHLKRWYCVQVSPWAAHAPLVCGTCSSPTSTIHPSIYLCVWCYTALMAHWPATLSHRWHPTCLAPFCAHNFYLWPLNMQDFQELYLVTFSGDCRRVVCRVLWFDNVGPRLTSDPDFLNVTAVERSPTTHFTRPLLTMITKSSLHVCICARGWKRT